MATEKWMQVDIKKIDEKYTFCNLYADGRCVQVVMLTSDYELLLRDGFFIRSGKEADSAGVLNTTNTYHLK